MQVMSIEVNYEDRVLVEIDRELCVEVNRKQPQLVMKYLDDGELVISRRIAYVKGSIRKFVSQVLADYVNDYLYDEYEGLYAFLLYMDSKDLSVSDYIYTNMDLSKSTTWGDLVAWILSWEASDSEYEKAKQYHKNIREEKSERP